MRWLLEFGSKAGKTSVAATGGSPADPLFWVWHPIFDKMLHVGRLSPYFKTRMSARAWSATMTDACGSHWLDHLPFDGIFDNSEKGIHFTNKELWALLDPTNDHLPYIYDQFMTWGDLTWDALDIGGAEDHK